MQYFPFLQNEPAFNEAVASWVEGANNQPPYQGAPEQPGMQFSRFSTYRMVSMFKHRTTTCRLFPFLYCLWLIFKASSF